MRSHLAVYRAPENANVNCQFARYALQPATQRQHATLWNAVPAPTTAAAAALTPTAAACYNLRAQLHHGLYHAAAASTPPPQAQQLLVNQQRINECAGIPLISNASSHLTHAQRHRLLRKSAKLWPTSSVSASSAAAGHSMSQLAAHAQGQPLLQNNKLHHAHLQQQQLQQQHSLQSWPAHAAISYQAMRHNSNNNFQMTDKSRTLRYQNSAPAVLNSQEQQQQTSNGSNSIAGQDQATSVADSCLPRIIKPRKRRKKDRKPANGVLLKMDAEQMQPKLQQHQQTHQQHQHQQQQHTNYAQQLLPISNCHMQHHDHSHGVCFCRDCDPLRSLWDYPLRRSHSDASGGSVGGSSSNASSSSTHSDNSCASSICSAAANNFDETTEHFAPITGDSSRAEIVGVIGSQRSHAHTATTLATTATATQKTTTTPAATTAAAATTLYLSDSNDSGYGDILSGMNIANDLFASCFNKHAANASSSSAASNCSSSSNAASAETLLNESINEISRKLIETCAVNELPTSQASHQGLFGGGGGGDGGGCSAASDDASENSCSASGSDSGLDSAGSYCSEALVFNFEHLNLMDAGLVTPTATDFHIVDCNNNNNNKCNNKQQFYNNCFDLVWRSSNNDSNTQMTAATPTTSLILGTVGKLKPAFSTIS
ncbi:putative uncharacterized protein DDB_G0277255 [Drosophila grimshawi]|uniref:putative uncharacterized protein DDB_G0277255 n=1 Tax=Drosophila grimshawi TaxID=7222 RepID=UPI000C86E6D1|nr:putative uncharacterized protein DDB_G0277255 [Drosophila grimshawi]